MTLLDKIITQNRIDSQLYSQLAEMSYRAINGTRQEPRNFRETAAHARFQRSKDRKDY